LADLYVGFCFMALLMILVEGSAIAGLLWAAPLLAFGNVWCAIWLLVRLPRLAERLRRPPSPKS
jgi:hypothetical protein